VHDSSPSATDSRIREFFAEFSTASDALDLDVLARCFADPFLSADATGARPVPRAAFLRALPRRAQMFADAGLGAATLTELSHSRLDDHYLLARTQWCVPRDAGGEPLQLASSYLLHDDGGELRIVLYLNHLGLR
jgi:ketosteroid isomerase-like protein